MSEIHDLGPDKPAGELLTPGQVALYTKAHGAEKPCAACGHDGPDAFEMLPEHDLAFVQYRGQVLLFCRQCGAQRTFLRPRIVAWLREARGG